MKINAIVKSGEFKVGMSRLVGEHTVKVKVYLKQWAVRKPYDAKCSLKVNTGCISPEVRRHFPAPDSS